MSRLVASLVVVASLIAVLGSQSTFAQSDKKMAGKDAIININKDGYALHENDAVELTSNHKVVKGDRNFTATHGGAKYVFASAENMKTFQAKPESYVPAYGGYCAYGVGLGKLFDVDPSTAVMVDGRLMLNKNADVATAFAKDLKGNVAKADKEWPNIKK